MYTAEQLERLEKCLSSYYWRINNLYKIKDAKGNAVDFKLNWAQEDFLADCWYFNVILKARQLGFSTVIDLHGLDRCLFRRDQSFGIIAQGEKEAQGLLDNCRFAYNNLPADIKSSVVLTKDNTETLEFSNGSKIVAGISLRSGTYQILHVSEYGKTSAKFPEKAREIKTGALNTVHVGQQIFVESTAEGQAGEFYDLTKTARNLADKNTELTPLDPRFHFYAWFQHPDYALSTVDALRTVITAEDRKYFDELEKEHFIKLTLEQQAWYVKKRQTMGEDMMREFPSTPDEAFKASVAGAIYAKEMRVLRKLGRLTVVPWEPRYPVHTFWDFGKANYMAVWFFQQIGLERRFIKYYQNTGQDFQHYADYCFDQPYSYGVHHVPHDGAIERLGLNNTTYEKIMRQVGFKKIKVIPVTKSVWKDIDLVCKPALMQVWIDEKECAEGIKCLDNYKKVQNKDGIWMDEPKHDEFSDGSDAFRTYAVGYRPMVEAPPVSFAMNGKAPL